jgi:hypothetical protein
MKKYRDIDSGEIWTEEEVREQFEQFKDEMPYESFDDYMDDMLSKGRQRITGLEEVEE